MTIEEVTAALQALQTTVAQQAETIALQAVEIARCTNAVQLQADEVVRHRAIVQDLSESQDQNRRELQQATKVASDFTEQMEQHVLRAEALRAELAEEKRAIGR